MGSNLGEAWACLRGWRTRCLQPHQYEPAWTHLVDGLHATSRQGGVNVKSSVSLHFQQTFMLHPVAGTVPKETQEEPADQSTVSSAPWNNARFLA